MSLVRSLRLVALRTAAFVLPILVSAAALAATDKRSVAGATADMGPAVPEPTSILLYVAGIAVVGYGAHRIHRRAR